MNNRNPKLRIFSYLPNPRIFKSTIVARICGIDIEVRGSKPHELENWLWDFDARPLSKDDRNNAENRPIKGSKGFNNILYKTESFQKAHPFGAVPAAFSETGEGIFESNSIMRYVARLGGNKNNIYGKDKISMSRIDSFLDASLVFARDAQLYLLSLMQNDFNRYVQKLFANSVDSYLSGITRELATSSFIGAQHLNLADICFVSEMALIENERIYLKLIEKNKSAPIIGEGFRKKFSVALDHYSRLCDHPQIKPELHPYLESIKKIEMNNLKEC